MKHAVGVIALLALAATSLGLAAGSPSAADPGVSVASHVKSTTSGQCSKAEAIAAVRRLGLRDISPTYPVWKVLCGRFTGAVLRGSQTMVASINGDGNLGMRYWAVFQWTGSEWQFLMKQRHAAILTAVGSDIRETWSIYRPADSRCCPSGGTKSRTWHWNGSRFTASPWKQVTAGSASAPVGKAKTGYFKTPSANIVCGYGYGGKDPAYVGCRIKSGLKPRPAPLRGPKCFSRNEVFLRATGATTTGHTICPGEDEGDAGVFVFEDQARVLGYGTTWSGGGLRCTSALTGLTCRNKSGHGFFLSREHWRAF